MPTLAVASNFVVTNDAEERVLSSGVFGQPPDQYQLARFFLMQQVVHMFYAMAFVLFGSSGKPVNLREKVPEFKDFHRRIWAGEVSLADNDMKIVCGRVHWEQLLQNMQQARFDEALGIVSDRHFMPVRHAPALVGCSINAKSHCQAGGASDPVAV